jgi:hypothetical protein
MNAHSSQHAPSFTPSPMVCQVTKWLYQTPAPAVPADLHLLIGEPWLTIRSEWVLGDGVKRELRSIVHDRYRSASNDLGPSHGRNGYGIF